MLSPNSLNAQCTVPGFPFVDQSFTNGWTAELQEQGYDVTTDANGDIYAVGMTYKSNAPNPNNNSDLTVYKLDNCGQMLWKTQIPSSNIWGNNIWADEVHSGKILVVNGKVYFGVSNEIEITSRIYRLDASNGSAFPYPNSGKNYVEFKGKMTDFDLKFAVGGQPEELYVASVYTGNQEGLIMKFEEMLGYPEKFTWIGHLTPLSGASHIERLEFSLNHDDSRLYIGFTAGDGAGNPVAGSVVEYALGGTIGSGTAIFLNESAVFYLDVTGVVASMPLSQTPFTFINGGFGGKVSDIEVVEDNSQAGYDVIYVANSQNAVHRLNDNLVELAPHVFVDIDMESDKRNYLYHDENSFRLYVVGEYIAAPTNMGIMQIEVYENLLQTQVWTLKQDLSPPLVNTLANFIPVANGIATDPNGNIFTTGSINAMTPVPFGSVNVQSADHSDIFIARTLDGYTNAPYFGKIGNITNETAALNQVERLVEADNNEDSNISNSITTRPNPATNLLKLEIAAKANDASIALFDLHGRLLQSIYQGQLETAQQFTVNVENLSAGIYFVRLNLDGKITTKRVVIVK